MKEKLHTADHILFTALENKFKIKTRGMEFGEDSCRVDYESETDLRPLKEEMEKEVNDIIETGLEVLSYPLAREEADKITDTSLIPASVKKITIYEIKGFNKIACAGPHVKNTKEIGRFEIINIKKKGKNVYSIKYRVNPGNIYKEKPQEDNKMELELAKGVRDFPPEEKIVRNEVVDKLKVVFEKYGYSPFETPIIERLDVLSSKGGAGEESDAMKETFRLTDQGGRKLGLRFELTLSFSRFIGMNPTIKMPFKRYEIGPVFRDGPIKLGRYRQFWQCDVDVVGTDNMMTDAELIMLALDCFKELGLDAYLQINNRKLLKGFIEFAGIDAEKADSVIISVDKLDKFGKDEVIKELESKGIESGQTIKLIDAMNVKGTNEEKLKMLKSVIKNEIGQQGLKEIEEMLSYLDAEQKKKVVFNPALARGLGYYTGPIFEGYLNKSKITSSICGGGRYDKMIGQLLGSGKEYPAVGISFGLDVITDAIKLEKKEEKKTVTQVYVIPIGTPKESMAIAQKLREKGIKTDISVSGKGISKNLDYANSLGIPYVIFIGSDELKQKKVKLRDMKTGKEEMISAEGIEKKIK